MSSWGRGNRPGCQSAEPSSGSSRAAPTGARWLSLLAADRSNPEIGQALFISTKTASMRVSIILAKLGASGRVEAAATADRLGV